MGSTCVCLAVLFCCCSFTFLLLLRFYTVFFLSFCCHLCFRWYDAVAFFPFETCCVMSSHTSKVGPWTVSSAFVIFFFSHFVFSLLLLVVVVRKYTTWALNSHTIHSTRYDIEQKKTFERCCAAPNDTFFSCQFGMVGWLVKLKKQKRKKRICNNHILCELCVMWWAAYSMTAKKNY